MKHFLSAELRAVNAKTIPVDPKIVAEFADITCLAGRFIAVAVGYGTWNSDMEWISADNEEAFAVFQSAFDRLGIAEHAKPYLDIDQDVRLFAGTVVVRSRCSETYFHSDWTKLNNEAFTVMTPITPNAEDFGLLYKTIKGEVCDYRYRVGEAIMFGDNFVHSTKPGHSNEPVMLLNFECGTDKMKYWDDIRSQRTDQLVLLKRPDGSFMRVGNVQSRIIS